MARPREFDEASALDAAMRCFWRNGFEATSLRDLTKAMGLTAPSIYNAFGEKAKLFGWALDHYLEKTTRVRLRRLEESFPPKRAIEGFFAEIIEHSISDRQQKGCFLVNAALEVAPHDRKCRALVGSQLADIELFFKRCILAGQSDKTIRADIDAGDTARLLLGVLLGIRVRARLSPKREVLEGTVRPALAILDTPKNRTGARR